MANVIILFYARNLMVRHIEITCEMWEIACMCVIGNRDYSLCFSEGFCSATYTRKFWRYFTICDTARVTEFESLFITGMNVDGAVNLGKRKQECLIGKKRKLC